MKMKKSFKVGDKVFAKVKGYPPWPAHVIAENGKKFNVEFYGTRETGVIKPEDLFYYAKNKERFQKPLKRKDYLDAFDEIEAAIQEDGGDGDASPDVNDSTADFSMNSSNASLNASVKEKKGPKKLTTKSSDSNESISNKSNTSQSQSETPVSSPKEKKSLKRDRPISGKSSTEATPVKKSLRMSKSEEGSNISEENDTIESEQSASVKKSPKTPKLKKDKERENNEEDSTKAKEFEFVPIEAKKSQNKGGNENLNQKDIHEKVEERAESLDFKVGIVSEKYLKNNIAYANHIKELESIYKEKPVEPREDFISQVLPVKLPSGVMGGIKLHLNWPIKYENEFDRALYDESVATRVLDAEAKILAGDTSIVNNHELFISNIEQTAEDVKQSLFLKDIESKKARIDRLKLEADLVNLDVKIKNSLGLDKAHPKEALVYLEEMCKTNFDDIMLKKHIHIVEMVRRLRKYVGNTKEWNMSDDSLVEFSSQAEKVRAMAESVYAKFKKVVKVPENSVSFFEGFTELASRFRADCKDLDMSEAEIFVVCNEPRSRKAFFDRLEEKETEKENSSGIANNEQESSVNKTPDEPADES